MPDEEIPLEGGNITAGVVRVGDTVRRPLGPSSELSHAVLLHLEEVGFRHAPRFLGIDEQGREILTFTPGRTLWPHEPDLLDRGGCVEPAAALVADFRDAMATFPSSDPILHGDLAPWNVVVGEDGVWTLIDWDEVEEGEPAWELAYVLHTFLPLWPTSTFADDVDELRRRLDAFTARLGAGRAVVDEGLRRVPAKCRSLADATEAGAAAGRPSFVKLVADGHPKVWRDAADAVERRLPALLDR